MQPLGLQFSVMNEGLLQANSSSHFYIIYTVFLAHLHNLVSNKQKPISTPARLGLSPLLLVLSKNPCEHAPRYFRSSQSTTLRATTLQAINNYKPMLTDRVKHTPNGFISVYRQEEDEASLWGSDGMNGGKYLWAVAHKDFHTVIASGVWAPILFMGF